MSILRCETCQGTGHKPRELATDPNASTDCDDCEGIGFYDPTMKLRRQIWAETWLYLLTILMALFGVTILVSSPWDSWGSFSCIPFILTAILIFLIVEFGLLPGTKRRMLRQLEAEFSSMQTQKPKRLELSDDGELVEIPTSLPVPEAEFSQW